MGSCGSSFWKTQRKRDAEGCALAELGVHGNQAAKPTGQGAHMGKPDPLAGLVLAAGTAEQLEDALMIFRVDAAAIVLDLEQHAPREHAAAHLDLGGDAGPAVFEGILDQVG